jgi:hypothetical protein
MYKFPQFWHCTVMCSAPATLELNAAWCERSHQQTLLADVLCVPHVKKKNMAACGAVVQVLAGGIEAVTPVVSTVCGGIRCRDDGVGVQVASEDVVLCMGDKILAPRKLRRYSATLG